ncbi:MAG: GAF domain-containing protein [Anaerolineae bacterium]
MAAKKRLLSMKEACHYLGVSRTTLLNIEGEGLISPARTPGGHRRYSIEELERVLSLSRDIFGRRPSPRGPGVKFSLPHFIEELATSPASTEQIMAEAIKQLVWLFQGDMGAIFTLDDEGSLRLQASYRLPDELIETLSRDSNEGVSARVLATKQPLVYSEAESEIPLPPGQAQGVCVPLIYRDTAMGVLHIISMNRYQFFPSEINVLSAIAIYLASLIVSSQYLRQYQQRLDELAFLNRMCAAMQTKVDLDQVLGTFLEETIAMMKADTGTVLLRDPAKGDLYVRVTRGFPEEMYHFRLKVGEGIAGWVVEHGEVCISPDLAHEPRLSHRGRDLIKGITSTICVPLKTEETTIGAFHISTRSPRTFSQEEVHFLSIVASQAAAIIQRAQLYEEMAELARKERLLRSYLEDVIENAPIGMKLLDKNLTVLAWNAAMERMIGIKREEIIGKNELEIIPTLRQEGAGEIFASVLSRGEPHEIKGFRHMTPTGEERIYNVKFLPLKNNEEISGAVLFVQDVTEV